jgi:hypothetical protein
MFFVRFAGRLAALLVLALAASIHNGFAQSTTSYFVKFPCDPNGFRPAVLSGDGSTVLGMSQNGRLMAWTKDGGLQVLAVAPRGISLTPVATSFSGNTVIGKLLRAQPIPKGCSGAWDIGPIDNTGAIFGKAACAWHGISGNGEAGFRITPAGAQPISAWLASKGINNDVDLNSWVFAVSGDGKTVLGVSNIPPPAAYPFQAPPKAAVSQEHPFCYFVAHVQ